MYPGAQGRGREKAGHFLSFNSNRRDTSILLHCPLGGGPCPWRIAASVSSSLAGRSSGFGPRSRIAETRKTSFPPLRLTQQPHALGVLLDEPSYSDVRGLVGLSACLSSRVAPDAVRISDLFYNSCFTTPSVRRAPFLAGDNADDVPMQDVMKAQQAVPYNPPTYSR